MTDEEIRTDEEESEVEGHGVVQDKASNVEGTSAGAHDDEDSDDVEAHAFSEGGIQPIVAEGHSEG